MNDEDVNDTSGQDAVGTGNEQTHVNGGVQHELLLLLCQMLDILNHGSVAEK
jgi:hypothetical protein